MNKRRSGMIFLDKPTLRQAARSKTENRQFRQFAVVFRQQPCQRHTESDANFVHMLQIQNFSAVVRAAESRKRYSRFFGKSGKRHFADNFPQPTLDGCTIQHLLPSSSNRIKGKNLTESRIVSKFENNCCKFPNLEISLFLWWGEFLSMPIASETAASYIVRSVFIVQTEAPAELFA